jgi:hypothetical protein
MEAAGRPDEFFASAYDVPIEGVGWGFDLVRAVVVRRSRRTPLRCASRNTARHRWVLVATVRDRFRMREGTCKLARALTHARRRLRSACSIVRPPWIACGMRL